MTARRRVLITGAGGYIGAFYARHAAPTYDLLLTDRTDDSLDAVRQHGDVVAADVTDADAVRRLCDGVDTVVHLAGDPSPEAAWDSLLPANVVGTYNVMTAAAAAGCRRVVYASSIHAVSGYPADVQVKTSEPVFPGDLYGVTKCFGEALARLLAKPGGLSVIALRIGACQPLSAATGGLGPEMLGHFVSERDLCQLIDRSIETAGVEFAILHGISDNRVKRLDLTDTRERVGYEPVDDVADLHPGLREVLPGAGRTEDKAGGSG